ncbi:MAG TPA: hypothetical protein VEC35_11460 [Noviherbaspirillum sp.]|nr:hypothetical protein [Noviherbaspirillum sp.]
MLTTTYSMVVLSSEQQNARRILGKLEQCLQDASSACAGGVDCAWLERVLHKLMQVDRYCHQRTVELYVIPALREAPAGAGDLLQRLDTLCTDAMRILLYVCSQFERAAAGVDVDIDALVSTIELYCRHILVLLSLEEEELFPAARHLLPTEAWFQIAARCLYETSTKPAHGRLAHSFGAYKRRNYPCLRKSH